MCGAPVATTLESKPACVVRGTYNCMERTELLSLVSSASSLNQISSLMAGVRAWLIDHPDDEEMRSMVLQLSRMEREHFTY